MEKTNQTKIGNENFKIWLKKLDPVSRFEKMRDIAKTQASAGLRGSLIKSSLAQLSQRCVVMLIRVNPNQIKYYTRKKSVRRKENCKSVYKNEVKHQSSKHELPPSSVLEDNFDESTKKETDSTNFVGCLGGNLNEDCSSISKSDTHKFEPISKINSPSNLETNPNKKLKRKFQELFGDDFDDLSVNNNRANKLSSRKGNICAKNIKNYVSTTVNVNIYNASTNENDDDITKKKNDNEKNRMLNVNDSLNKRLRIDVSLSNDKSGFSDTNAVVLEEHCEAKIKNSEKSHHDISKKKLKKTNAKLHNEVSKSKNKTKHSKISKIPLTSLSENSNSPEEDPSIKELWSILGMESPTDRSESIIKSYPHPITGETVTVHNEPLGNEHDIQSHSLEEHNKQHIPQTKNEQPRSITSDTIEQPTAVQDDCTDFTIDKNMVLDDNISEEVIEPLCKIAETFSLANISAKESNLFDENTSSNSSKEMAYNKNINSVTNTQNQISTKNILDDAGKETQTIETILIYDDDIEDEDNNIPIANQNIDIQKNNITSKVGTIRVKNLGSLMDPQNTHQPHSREPVSSSPCKISTSKPVKINTINSQKVSSPVQEDISLRNDHISVEERFFSTYKYYFDELVESKIQKLGELLHLAITDRIRRNDRIKRAEQLSSDDLIKEEKQRAEKDFNDIMKIRGNEFAPICECIIKKFERLSKITLFIALVFRIMRHAEQIDPANKNYILETRNVIHAMLLKRQFKDKGILESLESDIEEFKEQVEIVGCLIEKAMNPKVMNKEINRSQNSENRSPTENIQLNNMLTTSEIPKSNNLSKSINSNNNTVNSNHITKVNVSIASESSMQELGSQNTIPQRKITVPAETVSFPNNCVFNRSVNQSSGSSNMNSVQISCAPALSIAFVSVPQPNTFTVQSNVNSNKRLSNKVIYSQSNLIPTASQHHVPKIAPAYAVKTSNVVNPPVLTTCFPQTSLNVPTTQRSIMITAVPTPSKINSAGSIRGQQRKTTTGNPSYEQPTHRLLNRLGTEINHFNMKNTQHPIIIREVVGPSSTPIIGIEPSTITITRHNDVVIQTKSSKTKNRLVNILAKPIELTKTTGITSTTVTSRNINKPIVTSIECDPVTPSGSSTTANLINQSVQGQVPSSSHCHPFVKRMPISGKMRMLFGNNNPMS